MTGKSLRLPALATGLSARLLLLTIVFVMLAEVLIFAPSIGRFRLTYLEERLSDAHLAILALDATPDNVVGEALERELLRNAEAYSVALTRPGRGKLMMMIEKPGGIDATVDLRRASFMGLIGDAFATLLVGGERLLRVIGPAEKDPDTLVEVVVDEAPLRAEMLAYGKRILALSLVISLFTAALVYLSLHRLLVRPMRRITESMVAFREDPEDVSRTIAPSGRRDEIGVAEAELAKVQEALRAALRHKTRLAGLGIAVTKINHDLGNILATALLLSDRLQQSEDPEVRHVTPTLTAAIERAAKLCEQTLKFAREGPIHLERESFDLKALVDDVGATLPARVNGVATWRNRLAGEIAVTGDREQLYRVFANLAQNAVNAGATRVEVSARQEPGRLIIEVADDGPGLAPRARERLFEPFSGTARPGGTGLGLAIARDLLRAHGGDIRLERSTAEGTVFALTLPTAESGGPQR